MAPGSGFRRPAPRRWSVSFFPFSFCSFSSFSIFLLTTAGRVLAHLSSPQCSTGSCTFSSPTCWVVGVAVLFSSALVGNWTRKWPRRNRPRSVFFSLLPGELYVFGGPPSGRVAISLEKRFFLCSTKKILFRPIASSELYYAA